MSYTRLAPLTLAEIEAALADGQIHIRMRNGNLWRLRRNGRTRLWKTRAAWFRIPVKAGMTVYDELTHESTLVVTDDGRLELR